MDDRRVIEQNGYFVRDMRKNIDKKAQSNLFQFLEQKNKTREITNLKPEGQPNSRVTSMENWRVTNMFVLYS